MRYDRLIVWFECFVLVTLFFTYMYFLVGSVVEIVLHKEVLVSIQETESRVGELEAAYFTHLDTLTPAMLPEYGLVAAAPHAYVTVYPATDRLTKRD
jgi:hypothetical protein